ncbi:ABC transporter ATP-binding protein [Maribrevibacterium harenarium]|uniref:ABC transporter ATP-binding protein n=1 Tax=Maribrevibacterium harenarium TaxID=2589817 RepID=A0A501WSI2_9GAMM|nr:ABC transporter ATP-binding protein [Maribrevibacterium harenarium]TPE52389.1 ABC transporter ATP-binding protein [Maribrevibacterium harenarium]
MSTPAINLTNLCQHYGVHRAVDHLTLTIPEGEIFGFLGHNGAGKTTTVHMLTTLTQPSGGQGQVFGFDLHDQAQDIRRLIGYVPENVRLYDNLTTKENLAFFAGLSGVEDIDSAIQSALAFLDIEHLANKKVGSFSKGMRQRVGLAQAILHQPKLLFLDEPASGLDPLGMKMLRELITKLNQEMGMTIFMNTHLISEIAKTCTSIGILSAGKLVFHGTIAEVNQRFAHEGAIEDLYVNVLQTQQKETV